MVKLDESCNRKRMSMNRDEVAIYISYIINKYLERESGEKRKQLLMKLEQLNDVAFSWLMDTRKKYNVKDFGYVFERYINN
jgi:hypothetical protein